MFLFIFDLKIPRRFRTLRTKLIEGNLENCKLEKQYSKTFIRDTPKYPTFLFSKPFFNLQYIYSKISILNRLNLYLSNTFSVCIYYLPLRIGYLEKWWPNFGPEVSDIWRYYIFYILYNRYNFRGPEISVI